MVRPEILDSSERTLKYSELLDFQDIPAAREHLVEKEVESVLRKSHVEHFSWLEKKLSTPFNKNLRSWPDFVELTERRNLFVHTDGAVSSQYIQVCREHKCRIPDDLKVGIRLGAPPEYFTNAFKCLYEIGFKLAHVIWRKMQPDEIGAIDTHLIDKTFVLIEIGEYEIASRILEFFAQDQMKHQNESTERVIIINLAQCYKWQNNQKKCKEILERFDWSAAEDRFKLAHAVLNDDFDRAFRLMKRLKHDEGFLKKYYKDWPLFQSLRKHESFGQVYTDCYGEEFKIEGGLAKEVEAESDELQPDSDSSAEDQHSIKEPAEDLVESEIVQEEQDLNAVSS